MIALLEAAPVKSSIVEQIVRRIHLSVRSGSLADGLESKLPLLQQMNPTGDNAAGAAIVKAEDGMRKWIAQERAREDNNEQSRYLSFE